MSLFEQLQATAQLLSQIAEHGLTRDKGTLRNDWTESLRRGIELCKKNGHAGDAETLTEVLQFLGGELP